MEITKIKNLFQTLEKKKDKHPLSAWIEQLQFVKDEVVMDYLKNNTIEDLDDLYWGIYQNCDFETKGNLQGYSDVNEFEKDLNDLRARIKEKIDRMKVEDNLAKEEMMAKRRTNE